MILTIEEARQKWCPHARQVWAKFDHFGKFTTDASSSTAAFNMVHEDRGARRNYCLCIADQCMSWRHLATLAVEGSRTPDRSFGYCGLAGQPLTPQAQVEIVEVIRMTLANEKSEAA